jgi:S1-C subfamily serine protease
LPGLEDDDAFHAPAKPLIPGLSGVPNANGARPMLGISCKPVTNEEAEALGFDDTHGLSVASVVPGSLAERLGIRAGDVVAELDGVELTDSSDVQKVLRDRKPTDELRATVYDAKKKKRNLSYTPPSDEKGSEKDAKKADESKGF